METAFYLIARSRMGESQIEVAENVAPRSTPLEESISRLKTILAPAILVCQRNSAGKAVEERLGQLRLLTVNCKP